ncbi:MAG: hypothetical protein IT578_00600 [Verrucomicrobiae bacterium]|nr:hypothetical protein [Verrucomicrobiae bacterium]
MSNLALTYSDNNNLLQVINSGTLINSTILTSGSASTNTALLAGAGSTWTNTTHLEIGYNGANNLLVVSNQADLIITGAGNMLLVGYQTGSSGNSALITDSNTTVSGASGGIGVGYFGAGGNSLVVSNGARMDLAAGNSRLGYSGTNNTITVTGTNSQINIGATGGLTIGGAEGGGSGSLNSLIIADGGSMSSYSTAISGSANSTNNRVLITGPGSMLSNSSYISVGNRGSGTLIISNGGNYYNPWASSYAMIAGHTASATGAVVVTGSGSMIRLAGGVSIGSNSVNNQAFGHGSLLLTDGGALEANTIYGGEGGTGTITNRGGIFQFTLNAPTINPLTPGAIVVTNGIVSFRAIANAPVLLGGTQLTNLTFQGNNAFQLNAATNATGLAGYTFDSVANTGSPTNYQRLILTGNNPFWRSAALTIGAGGELDASNSMGASIGAVLTNAGIVRVINSTLTYLSNVVVNGGAFVSQNGTNVFNQGVSLAAGSVFNFANGSSQVSGTITNSGTVGITNASVVFNGNVVNLGAWVSDPMTNAFNGNYTVGPTATVVAAAGDVYAFGSNFVMQSTNRAFDLSGAVVYFGNTNYGITTGTTNHLFDLTGSGALDLGSNFLNHTELATNFSIGRLTIALDNRLVVTGQVGGGLTNALYVGVLDLSAWATNAASLTNTLQAALSLPDINLYYDKYDPNNAYLGQETFALWGGGGLLIPIPEPGALLLLLAGTLALARRAPRRDR